jgi:hypothetical protein
MKANTQQPAQKSNARHDTAATQRQSPPPSSKTAVFTTGPIRFQNSKATAGGATWQKATKKSRQDKNEDAYLHRRSRSTR